MERRSSAIAISTVIRERRSAAHHPGPTVFETYLSPLGIDVADFARAIGMPADRVAAILSGTASFDVPTAIRFARALGLPAERIVKLQTAADFAAARRDVKLGEIEPYAPKTEHAFDESTAMPGRLGVTGGEPDAESFFFQQNFAPGEGDPYAGLHALWRGDALRVFGDGGDVVWTGPVMQNLDGRMLLPFVPAATWRTWFAGAYRARLKLGDEHAAFLTKMLA